VLTCGINFIIKFDVVMKPLKKLFQNMKKRRIKKLFFVPLVTMAITLTSGNISFAQASATAAVSATVIVPVSLAKNDDMNFGNAAVSASAGGVVILNSASSRSASGTGVTLPATTGTVTAANFTVSGAPSYTYAITLPSTASITGPSSSTMTVNSFTSTPSGTGTLSTGGTQTLTVGASLSVTAGQHTGTYTNASAVPITVNYN